MQGAQCRGRSRWEPELAAWYPAIAALRDIRPHCYLYMLVAPLIVRIILSRSSGSMKCAGDITISRRLGDSISYLLLNNRFGSHISDFQPMLLPC